MQHVDLSQENAQALAEYLIFSRSEAEATTIRQGFWSNGAGWGDFTEATRFTAAERETLALPSSAGADAQWVDAKRLQPFFAEQQQRATLAAAAAFASDGVSMPVLFELDLDTNKATGTVMPFCSTSRRNACGGTQYERFAKSETGTTSINDFGFEPRCEQCGLDIKTALEEQAQPQRGKIGFYRPDPSGPKSPNIVVEVLADKVKVFEMSGMVFSIDREEWMSRQEMEVATAAIPTDPRFASKAPADRTFLERLLTERASALAHVDTMLSMVDQVLAAHPLTSAPAHAVVAAANA